MTRKDFEDFSVEEIRFLLVDKRRVWRNLRFEHFHRGKLDA